MIVRFNVRQGLAGIGLTHAVEQESLAGVGFAGQQFDAGFGDAEPLGEYRNNGLIGLALFRRGGDKDLQRSLVNAANLASLGARMCSNQQDHAVGMGLKIEHQKSVCRTLRRMTVPASAMTSNS